jgi:hypothetical protein
VAATLFKILKLKLKLNVLPFQKFKKGLEVSGLREKLKIVG